MAGGNRKSGINIIGDIPWGTHFCQFYETPEDLISILVPYFKAGLENNEYCMWVTSEPLDEKSAREAIRTAMPDFDRYLKKGQIEIVPHDKWYLKDGVFDLQRVLNGWVDKLNQALAKGYAGLRLTGNTFWLEKNGWKSFTEYEAEVNKVIGNYRMIALCTYSLDRCGAAEVIDVVSNHQFALIRRQGKWQLMESTEHKQAEEKLQESEENFRRSLDDSPLGVRIITADGEIIYANQAILDIYGYDSIEELRATPTKKRYTPESYAEYQVRKTKRQRGEYIPSNYEVSIVRKDGEVRHLEVFRKEVLWNGKTQFQVLYHDVTERKQAEEALRESRERYKELADFLPQTVFEIDETGNFVFANRCGLEISGYTQQDIDKGLSALQLFIPEDRNRVRENIRRILAGERLSGIEYTAMRKDGSTFPVLAYSAPITRGGKPTGLRGLVVDITERKKAETALQESAEKLRLALDATQDGIWDWDIKTNKEYFSPRWCEIIGYTFDDTELPHSYDSWASRIHPEDSDHVMKSLSSHLEKGTRYDVDYRHLHKSGEYRWQNSRGQAIFDESGKPIRMVGCIRDITKRKKAEEALQRSESKYRTLVENIPQKIFLKDRESIYLSCNGYYAGDLGIRANKIAGKTDYDFYPKELAEKYIADDRRVMQSGETERIEEEYIEHGQRRFVHTTKTPVRDARENVIGILGIFFDITERRQQEKVREFTRSLLEIANLGRQLNPTLKEFVRVIRNFAGCDAVGIRILDSEGNIPYQAYEGFSREFYESESPLSIKLHHCMCINVIKGDTDLSLPYYTEDGSFYMNGTTAFLATVSEEEKGSTRNVCNEHGYESVALVPIRLGDKILGLIHIADKRTDMVPLGLVNALEDAAPQIGLSIRRLWAEHELAEEKERLEVTLRSTGDSIIAVDMEGKVVLLNRAAEELTGWTQKEAIGRAIREVFNIIDERNCQPIPDAIENVLKTGRVIGLVNHAILISRDGTERLIADSGAPIHDEQGRMFGVVLVFRDISELRKLQEEQLKFAKLESIGILAGGIAHDFNNILTAIMGNIGLARRYVEPQGKAFERLDEAEKASVRAKDLTQQLLTFSKGGAPIKKTAVISELVKETATFALSGSNVRLELSLPEDLWAVEIDEGQMSQVIQNIVINADEAMPAGGTLHISARNTAIQRVGALPLPKGNYVQIDIKDEGIGMSKQQLARIFEPYYTTKQKGSGLGLATAYSIIKNHGGYITAESTQNVGTTFHIYLPASRKPTPVKKKSAREQPVRGKGRILVMDDEASIRLLLSQMLTGSGYDVEPTKDGAEAVELYRKARESGQPFDAVILDLTVPGGMGGKETVKKLLEINPEAKVIVSSGYTTDPVMSEYKKYGFSAVVTKPYSVSQMEETLHDVLAGK